MSNIYFSDYDKKYPDLVITILEYFDIQNTNVCEIKDKSIMKFCEQFKDGNKLIYQPTIINRICKKLSDCGQMERLSSLGGNGWNDNYLFILKDKEWFEKEKPRLKVYYNCMVYGFDYIYELYRSIVVPLVCEKENGDYAIGTGFKFWDGIVTAKHCVKDATNLQIKGYKADELTGKPVFISDNDGVDIAFIQTGRFEEPIVYSDNGEVLQEVLVMGYPKIPSFTNFLTAEKALISSKASARITPTKGAIAAFGNEYLSKIEAMLITARIRGGNSGGPVINQNGCVVGIACQVPDADPKNGDYDDLGYGVAVPVSYLVDIIQRKPLQMDLPNDFYKDFVE